MLRPVLHAINGLQGNRICVILNLKGDKYKYIHFPYYTTNIPQIKYINWN